MGQIQSGLWRKWYILYLDFIEKNTKWAKKSGLKTTFKTKSVP